MTRTCDGGISYRTSLGAAKIAAEGSLMAGVCAACGESTDIFECPSLLDGDLSSSLAASALPRES